MTFSPQQEPEMTFLPEPRTRLSASLGGCQASAGAEALLCATQPGPLAARLARVHASGQSLTGWE